MKVVIGLRPSNSKHPHSIFHEILGGFRRELQPVCVHTAKPFQPFTYGHGDTLLRKLVVIHNNEF
jgi:hypothetical protein